MLAFAQLCTSAQSFLGILTTVLFVLGVLIFIISSFYKNKKILKTLAKASLAGALLLMIVYLAGPSLFPAFGIGGPPECGSNLPPYCGDEYCYGNDSNKTVQITGGNCTCLMYR
jgi:hypothetical protein